jgi:DNA-binding NtrC family response regulator
MSASMDGTRQRTLLIDDDELISGSLRQYLVLQGCAVDVAVTPAASEGLMAVNRYSTVIVDPYLTGGIHHDSAELLDRVCALQPHASVIVLTAYSSEALASAAVRCRVTALLRKPQSVVDLERLIRGAAPAASGQLEHQHV